MAMGISDIKILLYTVGAGKQNLLWPQWYQRKGKDGVKFKALCLRIPIPK
jgi:hypothetical protein